MSQQVNQDIEKMTFAELKQQLAKCDRQNPKNIYIRRLMKQRYLEHRNKRRTNKPLNNIDVTAILTEEDFEPLAEQFKNPGFESLNEIEHHENKFEKEIEKDVLNNNMMDRLNNDILLSDLRKKQKNKIVFIPPFSEEGGNAYTTIGTIPSNDFSNKRVLHNIKK